MPGAGLLADLANVGDGRDVGLFGTSMFSLPVVDALEPDPLLAVELDRREAEAIGLANASRPSLAIVGKKRGSELPPPSMDSRSKVPPSYPLRGTAAVCWMICVRRYAV